MAGRAGETLPPSFYIAARGHKNLLCPWAAMKNLGGKVSPALPAIQEYIMPRNEVEAANQQYKIRVRMAGERARAEIGTIHNSANLN